jgi:hypothetical protein
LHPLELLILLSPLYGVGWESLQISLFSMKIVKLPSFISVIHMEEGALALTSHITLVYLPSSLMLFIKFGCDSSPLYFHTLQHTLWAYFLRACAVSEIDANPSLVLVEEAAWP